MKADITASGEHAFQTGLGTWLKIVRGKKKRERERERDEGGQEALQEPYRLHVEKASVTVLERQRPQKVYLELRRVAWPQWDFPET